MKNIIKNKRKGATLIWVLIMFVVLMIIVPSLFRIGRQNIHEAMKQEERLQTYYIALSGIDLSYAALINLNGESSKIETGIINKIGNKTLNEKIDIKIGSNNIGIADVYIDRIKEINPETNIEVNWVRIKSVGQIIGKETKVDSILKINEKNINQMVRER